MGDGVLDIVDEEKRAMAMRAMVQQLPVKHRDCLEFLIFHLARVATRHHENLVGVFLTGVLPLALFARWKG